jgi:hypothetical protein
VRIFAIRRIHTVANLPRRRRGATGGERVGAGGDSGDGRSHTSPMFRKGLLELLRTEPRSVADVAHQLKLEPKDVEDDLRHLIKSVKHTGYRVIVIPAQCRHCGFRFHSDKLHKPGKCPQCHATWISPPLIRIEGRES